MLSEPEAAVLEIAPLHGGFKEGWVWVPDEKEGYLAGWVAKESINNERVVEGEIIMAAGAKVKTIPFHALSQMNSTEFDRVENIGELEFLNEASVAHSLKLRYASGEMYTYSGLCLISINPYIDLPLYTDAIIQKYRGKRCDQNPPHIFAVAELAWVNLVETGESQSIVFTGESGAGKTENTMRAVQYLVSITNEPANTAVPATEGFKPSNVQHQNTFLTGKENNSIDTTSIFPSKIPLKEQLLQANIILEAFGNARTARNANSSRFSKFVRIAFTKNGSFVGIYIDWYMLEKSRVVARSEIEQNFHVFYMLLEDEGLRDTLLLQAGTQEYEYLNKPQKIDGIDHREKWHLLKNALDIVGFTFDEQLDLFRVMAAILHIGNITIFSDPATQAQIKSNAALENTCKLLGISPQSFSQSILRPRVFSSQLWITLTRTRQQAVDDLDALCKTMYEKVFGFLIKRINRALDGPNFNSSFIRVLDITGFEMDGINGFEQLCINYTNERIQQFFNHHTFVVEREEYMRESVEWPFVDFGIDLQPTIELIGATGNNGRTGILTCLDEECIGPKSTDAMFTSKLHAMWALPAPKEEKLVHISQSKYTPVQFSEGFIIQHYAGRVEYQTDGWLVKNKDLPSDDIIRVMMKSNNQFVSALFLGLVDVGGSEVQNTVAFGNMKGRFVERPFKTVAQRHKADLAELTAVLQVTQPHFVRCIVPNRYKKPYYIDVPFLLEQLKCNSVVEGLRISRLGFPDRLYFGQFRRRYELFAPSSIRGCIDEHDACLQIVDGLGLNKSEYCIGTSKILFKAGVLDKLNKQLDITLSDIFSRVQAAARRFISRRRFVISIGIDLLGTLPAVRVGEATYPWKELHSPVLPESAPNKSYPTGWTGVHKEHQASHRPAKAITVRDGSYAERAHASSAPNAVHPRGTRLNYRHLGHVFPNYNFTSLTGAGIALEQTRSPTPTNFPGFPYHNQYGPNLGELDVLLNSVEQVISPASTRLSPTLAFDDTYKWETPIVLSKRRRNQSPSDDFWTDVKKRKFEPTYDAKMAEQLSTLSSLIFPPLETAHPSPSFYPNINPLLTTTQDAVMSLSPPQDPRIPRQLEQSGQCFVTPGGQVASSVYDGRFQFERNPNYTAQYRDPLINGVVKPSIQPTQAQLSSLSVRRVQRVKSIEMTPSTMFECLIGHGCLDLRTSIDPSRFSSCRVAEGGFGDVWKGQLTDGINVAIKVLRYGLVRDDGPKSIKRAMREIYNWSKLEHKNIHKLLGVTIFQERLGMVSKWMERGTLQQYLCKNNDINRYALCYQIAEGVAYLHSASVNMIHGDLKASNILVSSDGILELTDFDYSIISDCSLVFSATTRMGGGTLRWMAPELVVDEEPTDRNTRTDIYALGMTFLEAITNALPYSECQRDAQIYGKLSRRQHPKRPEEHFPANEQGNRAWELLVRCWDYDPFSRPTANQVLDTLAQWTSAIGDTEQLQGL